MTTKKRTVDTLAMPAFQDVGTGMARVMAAGEEIVGFYLGYTIGGSGEYGESQQHHFVTYPDRDVDCVFGTTMMNAQLSKVKLGRLVKVEMTGERAGARDMKVSRLGVSAVDGDDAVLSQIVGRVATDG